MENAQVRKLTKKIEELAKNKDFYGYQKFVEYVVQEYLIMDEMNYSSKKELLTRINDISHFFADFKTSENILLQLLELEKTKKIENQDYMAFIINLTGELYYYQGLYNPALKYFQNALDIRFKIYGDSHPDTVECYSNLAMLYTELGRFSEAEDIFLRVLKAYESQVGGHIEEYIKTIWNAGLMYQYWGKYSLAMEKYLTAMEISQLNATRDLTDSIENNLGVLYLETGNYKAAVEYLQKSSDFTLDYFGINHPKTIVTLNNLVSAQMNLGELKNAENGFLKLKQTDKSNMPMLDLKISINYAVFLMKTDKTKEALDLLQLSLNKSSVPEVRIKILSHMAKAYLVNKELDKAYEIVNQAIRLQEKKIEKNHIQYTRLLGLLGQILIHLSKKDEAFKNYLEASEIQNKILLQVSTSFSKDYSWNFLQKINSELNQLISLFLILHKERSEENPIIPQYLQELYQILLRRKAVVFDAGVERYQQILKKRDPHIKNLFEKLIKIKEEIILRTTKGYFSDTPEENQRKLRDLASKAEILENRISTVVPIYSHEFKTKHATLELLKSKIPEKTLFVDFFKFHIVDFFNQKQKQPKIGYLIFYIQKDITKYFIIEDATEIERLIKKTDSTNNNLNRGINNQFVDEEQEDLSAEEALGKLWHILFENQEFFKKSKSDSLCISPDGDFFNLPFESLICKNGEYLIENFRVQYISSGRQLIYEEYKEKSDNQKMMVFADPCFQIDSVEKASNKKKYDSIKPALFRNELNQFPRLPGTASEAEEIINVFKKHDITSYTISTRETVNDNELKKMDSTQILHFATHGFYLENRVDIHPFSRCGIALSGINNVLKGEMIPSVYEDGMLTGMDILSLNLTNTDLVVLSACKTGRGQIANGEGVMGLCSALISSGASSVMVSLWNVPDIFTVCLMSSFYENLITGMAKSEALRISKRKMIQTLRAQWGEAPSWIWGGFILYGDDSPITDLSPVSIKKTDIHGEKN